MSLTTSEISAMRVEIANLMPDTCAILSLSSVPDGQGGSTDTWGTATASVACRLDPYRGTEVMAGGAVQAFNTYVLTVPYDTTINTAHRVVVGTDTYNITAVDSNKSWDITRRVYLERV